VTIAHRLVMVPAAALLGVGGLGSAPARAAFGDAAATPAMQVTTMTVAAPGNVTGTIDCTAGSMSVTWSLSTSSAVTGYQVTAQFNKGTNQTTQLGPTATSWSGPLDPTSVQGNSAKVVLVVTTVTSYGWTASAQSKPLSC
jgi:hypothetical protein